MRKTALGFAALAAFASTPALAGTSTNSMPVSVNIINSCTISASPMAFGTLTAIGGANVDTTATVDLTCTTGAAYDVSMDFGVNATAGQRYLAGVANSANKIPYNVYTDAGRTAAWGNTSGVDTVAGTATTGSVSLTAYGRIPASAPSMPADAYLDTVTVTVNF